MVVSRFLRICKSYKHIPSLNSHAALINILKGLGANAIYIYIYIYMYMYIDIYENV